MTINVYDNFFTQEDFQFIFDYCKNASYFYGEYDNECDINNEKYCTGLVHEVYYYTDKELLSNNSYQNGGGHIKTINQKKFFDLFTSEIEKKFPEHTVNKSTRLYINCFAPAENPYFHTDGNVGTTFLYYPNMSWDIDDCGETQFFIDGNFYGIAPIPNRMISFDANILHKATSFRDKHRFSVAIKYGIHLDPEWTD
jgi:hypothetical protein